jgi:hypothetical protein
MDVVGGSAVPEPDHLNSHQRDTLLQVFQHPTSHNIEWHDVLTLLEAVGSVERRHDDKYVVRIGGETEVITRPKHKDVPVDQVVHLRRMLASAGYDGVVGEMEARGKED